MKAAGTLAAPAPRQDTGGTAPGRARPRPLARRASTTAAALVVPVLLLTVWEIYPAVAEVDPTVVPRPSLVLSQLWEFRDLAWDHARQTAAETVIGFSCSLVVAAVVAALMDRLLWLRRGLYPLLVASQTVPIIAIAPLMIIWFGFGLMPKVLIVILVTFFPIVVSLLDGFASTDQEGMRLLRTMGASSRQIFFMVRVPTALPHFFTGVRIAITYAVTAAIVAEYVGAEKGLGIWMMMSKSAFQTDLVFAAILITALMSTLLFLLVGLVARLVMPWYYAQRSARR
ncbi:ABC transporter permease [Nocardioides caldifontis]|uniref:ABC transporter permease n=1 Tax=Nocardioides caldifontis TaxID=2588938 RepID=UPI0011E03792|nr:ABC transporter permease [Nocardioides caldifontis]